MLGERRESEKGRTEDALALTSDEGRDKLRKAAVRRKWPLTRGCPNGKTRQAEGLSHLCEVGERRELKHLSTCRKREQNVIPPVVASERGLAQTAGV